MTASLVDLIESFNRKERHILWEQATVEGGKAQLSGTFKGKLAECGIDVPDQHIIAVDFHLDWLYAALLVHAAALSPRDPSQAHAIPEASTPEKRAYRGNQEDIDLLIAFEQAGQPWVVMVEAKGFTSWGKSQMESKVARLRAIRSDPALRPGVEMRLILASFEKWQNLPLNWREWGIDTDEGLPAEPHFLQLDKPQDRLKPEECDAAGKRSKGGGHVHIIKG